jgi:hypothetical protein
MTQREKTLAGLLVGMLVFVGGGVGGYMFVYRPLTDVNSQLRLAEGQLKKKEQELSAEEQQIEGLLRVNPRLNQWPKLSLPPRDPSAKKVPSNLQEEAKKKHLNRLQVDYERYLANLLKDSKLKKVLVSPRALERQTARGFRGPQPTYEQLAFGVEAQGTMAEVAKALREIHKTPLLHKVRGLTLTAVSSDRPGGGGGGGGFGFRRGPGAAPPSTDGTLDVKMVVEALMVTGGEERVGLLPGKLAYAPKVLAPSDRDYSVLDKRNMFTGFSLHSIDVSSSEEVKDVLRFVRLTMLYYNPKTDRWEATLYDQAKGGAEKKLSRSPARRDFTIADRYQNEVLNATVVLLDDEQLIYLDAKDKKHYRLYCGEFVHPRTALTRSELKELDIDPVVEEKEEDNAEEEG